uniref:Zf-AD domain-containing protein n=1 Tax=Strongyloides papillosus TaxID=174720 RepID=A0A0N5CE40_STREA
MPLFSDKKYICPLCYEARIYNIDTSYSLLELEKHFKDFHGHEPGTLWKTKCQKCIEEKSRGARNIKINELTLSCLIRHMSIKGCFQVHDSSVSSPEVEPIDQSNNTSTMENEGNTDNNTQEIYDEDFLDNENEYAQDDNVDEEINN